MSPLEYFRLLAPEFSGVDDTTVNKWLAMAGNLINVGCLTAEAAAMAQALYAAHMLSLATRTGNSGSGAVGPITREKEGDLERSYGASKGSDTYLGQTPYGQQYKEVTLPCAGSAIMTRGPMGCLP